MFLWISKYVLEGCHCADLEVHLLLTLKLEAHDILVRQLGFLSPKTGD